MLRTLTIVKSFNACAFNKKKPKIQKNFTFKKKESVLLYPEGLITLNSSACEIMSMCNGNLDISEIKDIIYDKYSIIDPIQLNSEIDQLLKDAYLKNWIY